LYVKHVDTFEPSDRGWDEVERQVLQGWRWWTPDEIERTDELVRPVGLAPLIRTLHAGGVSGSEPLQLPWEAV
jgi:hypothetical protein